MYAAIIRFLRLGSIVACSIVIASFAMFAVNQTGDASEHQQQIVAESEGGPGKQKAAVSHESSVRKTVDEASKWLTSPFSGITSGSHSEWGVHAADLLLALLVYGFAIGFLARSLRVRV